MSNKLNFDNLKKSDADEFKANENSSNFNKSKCSII